MLTSAMTSSQFVGAWYANSLSLLIDCSSMLVDVISYSAATWVECSPSGKGRNEMIVSALSMLALWGVTVPGIIGALAVLDESHRREQLAAEGIDMMLGDEDGEVSPRIILGFAIAGIVCDAVAVSCFCAQRPKTRRAQHKPLTKAGQLERTVSMHRALPTESHDGRAALAHGGGDGGEGGEEDGTDEEDGGSAGYSDRDAINMRSAFAHVLTDSCRSVSTAVAAVLILFFGFEARKTDALCSLIVAAFVISTSVDVCKMWCTLACADIRGVCGWRVSRASRRTSTQQLVHAVDMHELSSAAAGSSSITPASADGEDGVADGRGPAPTAEWHQLSSQRGWTRNAAGQSLRAGGSCRSDSHAHVSA
ncbi:hypothetical protein T492DRAFT_1061345 [Pavlovales sp. CCMP2436]|nr:hypothetical protein T492DRAFT_1061345 [Pavlovales sp. CCMP2436]